MNSVPGVCADNAATVRLGNRFTARVSAAGAGTMHPKNAHDFANVAEEGTGLANCNGSVESLARGPDEFLGIVVDLSNGVCGVEVTVEAAIIQRDIYESISPSPELGPTGRYNTHRCSQCRLRRASADQEFRDK